MLGITLGDPGGIGPEVAFKALRALELGFPVVCFGPLALRTHPALAAFQTTLSLEWVDTGPEEFTIGAPCAANGQHALRAIEAAVDWAQSGANRRLVTAPISKTSMSLALAPAFDHTTLLTQLTHAQNVRMGFASPKLCTVLHSIHIPLAAVPHTLTEAELNISAQQCFRFAQQLGFKEPRVAVAGLNPHAGEAGLMGREELDIISPFITTWNHLHPSHTLAGPYPSDTLYHRAANGEFEMILSLYHDQALIPIKLIAFESAVNVTLGLPFVRTSPDHGTAFDLAYQDRANPSAMIAAITLAQRIAP